MSDSAANDAVRVIRLIYDTAPESTFSHTENDAGDRVSHYISIVFDSTGQMIDLHSERPVDSGL